MTVGSHNAPDAAAQRSVQTINRVYGSMYGSVCDTVAVSNHGGPTKQLPDAIGQHGHCQVLCIISLTTVFTYYSHNPYKL